MTFAPPPTLFPFGMPFILLKHNSTNYCLILFLLHFSTFQEVGINVQATEVSSSSGRTIKDKYVLVLDVIHCCLQYLQGGARIPTSQYLTYPTRKTTLCILLIHLWKLLNSTYRCFLRYHMYRINFIYTQEMVSNNFCLLMEGRKAKPREYNPWPINRYLYLF